MMYLWVSKEKWAKNRELGSAPKVTQGTSGTEKKMHTEAETGRGREGAAMREEVARSQEKEIFQEDLRDHVRLLPRLGHW